MRPVALLIADVKGWAFDQNNQDLMQYLKDEFDFRLHYLNSPRLPINYDIDFVYCPWHNALGAFSTRTLLGALRSEYFDTINRSAICKNDIDLINCCAGFQICTKKVYDQLKDVTSKVVYLPNPVNMLRFPYPSPKKDTIIAQWNGNALHFAGGQRDIKGFSTIINPACSRASVVLKYAEFNTCRLSPSEMPRFYAQANVALCASEFEGCSNSVLEAMAAGLAVIATDVGNHRELHDSMIEHYGKSGMILVDRTVDSFVNAINDLTPDRANELGLINRMEVSNYWSWRVWADRYKEFFRMAL